MASAMTRSPLALVRWALALGQAGLPRYANRFSRHDYTQPQLLAILVLRAYWRMDYRSTSAWLADWPNLLKELGLSRVPHPATLCRAQAHLLKQPIFRRLMNLILRRAQSMGLMDAPATAIVDSTGLESRYVSAHYRVCQGPRKNELKPRWPKLTLVCHGQSHLWAAAITGRGPSNDAPTFRPVMRQAAAGMSFVRALADKGFDAEANHALCRRELGIRSTAIPLIRRRNSRRWPSTPYRRLMYRHFPKRQYGQRWQIESAISRHKRRLGSSLRAQSYQGQNQEMKVRVLTHNLMIIHAPHAA